jgi:PKD-like domain
MFKPLQALQLFAVSVILAQSAVAQAATITLQGVANNACTYTSITPGTGAGDLIVNCQPAVNVCTLTPSVSTVTFNVSTPITFVASTACGANPTINYSSNPNYGSGTVSNNSFTIGNAIPANTVYTFTTGAASATVTVVSGPNAVTAPSNCTINGPTAATSGQGSLVYSVACTGGSAPTTYSWSVGSGLNIATGQGTAQLTASASTVASTTVASVSVTVGNTAGSTSPSISTTISPGVNLGCTAAPTTNIQNVDLNGIYQSPQNLIAGFTTAGQIFVGKFRYQATPSNPKIAQVGVEFAGQYAGYGDEQKEIVVSKCPGSFATSDYAGGPNNIACRQLVNVGAMWFDNAQAPVSPYNLFGCHLTPNTEYYINYRTPSGRSTSYLLSVSNVIQ